MTTPLVTTPSGSVELNRTPELEVLNGYTVVAERPDNVLDRTPGDRRVILGVRAATGGHREYVTAVIGARGSREWVWGHYFHTGGTPRAFEVAVRDFDNR